jgi:hypothetical protein
MKQERRADQCSWLGLACIVAGTAGQFGQKRDPLARRR